MSQFEARSANMKWDWQQFTPSSTPTTTVFDFDINDHSSTHTTNNSSAATPTQTHFHDAFPAYDYAHHKRDSIASTATSIDTNTHGYATYPQIQPQLQHQSQPRQQQQHQVQQQQQHQQLPPQQLLPQQQLQQHQHQPAQPQPYQSFDYASSPVFVQGPGLPQTFQMQTPPPTRGSSIKRRPQRLDSAMLDPSAQRQPELNTATFSFAAPTHSMTSWTHPAGPASAPLSAPAWTANAEDPFSNWSAQSSQASNPSQPPPSSHSHTPSQPSSQSRPTITRSTSSNNVPYATPTAIKKASGPADVDPLHRRSSPVRRHFPNTDDMPPSTAGNPCLAPAFPSTSGPSSPVKGSGLQRSNTVGNFLKPSPTIVSHVPDATASLGRSNSVCNLPRRSSPLKRIARGSLSSIAETSQPQVRTSVVLTIDANGTARTETRVIEESPTRAKEETQSIKDKYPNLWDDSDSDSDSTPANKWPNRHDSLAQPNAGQERSAKMARLDTSSDNLEIAQLPRSNSTASLKTPSKAVYAIAVQLRRHGSAKKQQRPASVQSRRNTLSSLNSSFENLAAMDLNRDEMHMQTDAGSALRQAAAHRVSPPSKQARPAPYQEQPDHAIVQAARAVHQDAVASSAPPSHPLSQPQHIRHPLQLRQPHQVQHAQPPQAPQIIPQPQPLRPQHTHQVQQMNHFPLSNQNHPHAHAKSHSVNFPTATSTAPVFDPRGSFTMGYAPVVFAPAPSQPAFINDMSPMTRCICQIPFDDGRMIQCNLCAMYSHSGCVGLNPSQHAYVCSFCVSATPNQYGHPARSSSMQDFNAWTVPGL
ncbi:hypothetical protein AUEXF2481DRAFT_30999 [Aureobasidium subglaciale EXF-2481]|uniref:Zinc finger PHD-type domain-containing protein n=1 Tax=Aureobasidium subglaciale (strain EXF-2481) TaxID=1043005 RepID=A0A074Y817_AURSE|nr:uncharacterized protein AUEXF2481DRAFT_30999 [Aureobasidium subglaciale EXF-2481]KAI5227570.1 hypothetical protein E4T40_02416 [Aureobasidium subglaciale]KEQ93928.1 hypothetical protein AUEXF2481DRAFT_30999 [Aureobasidium subglaciale EXF-2481]